mmetsp:Transcript_13197/g.24703  ORF Transcript_13197/g.24703 Transcript_13197/m.24703 type:complete len:608 (-) Transcript_13197:430-2253(-)
MTQAPQLPYQPLFATRCYATLNTRRFPTSPSQSFNTFSEFYECFTEELQKFRDPGTGRLMTNPRRCSKTIVNISTKYPKKSSGLKNTLRRLSIKTLNSILEFGSGIPIEGVTAVAECISVLHGKLMFFKARALSVLNESQVILALREYTEVRGVNALHLLLRTCVVMKHMMKYPYLIMLSHPTEYLEFREGTIKLIEIGLKLDTEEGFAVLTKYVELLNQAELQHLLGVLSELWGLDQDHPNFRGLQLHVKALAVKKHYLKLALRLEALAMQESPKSEWMRLTPQDIQNAFEATVRRSKDSLSNPDLLRLLEDIETKYSSVSFEASSSLRDLDGTLAFYCEDANRIEKLLDCYFPKAREDKCPHYYWVESSCINKVNLQGHRRHLFNLRTPQNVFEYCVCNGKKLTFLCRDERWAADIQREYALSKLPKMHTKRNFSGWIFYEECLYTIGGRTTKKIYDCERLSFERNRVEILEPLILSPRRPMLAAVNTNLYVTGRSVKKGMNPYYIQELCLVSLTWRLLDVRCIDRVVITPLLFTLPNNNTYLFFTLNHTLHSLSLTGGGMRAVRAVDDYTCANVNCRATESTLFYVDTSFSLVTLSLGELAFRA